MGTANDNVEAKYAWIQLDIDEGIFREKRHVIKQNSHESPIFYLTIHHIVEM